MPRLTGALITVAGFMPIGFAKLHHRPNTRAASSGSSASPCCSRGSAPGLITPYLAVKMLPKNFGQQHHGADPYDTPFYRKLRGWIDFALEQALAGHRRDGGRPGARARRHEVRPAAVLPEQRASRADPRPAHEGRRVVRRPRPNRSSAWKRC